MGDALTPVYRKGVLEAEGFPRAQLELGGNLMKLRLGGAAQVDPHHRVEPLDVLGDVGAGAGGGPERPRRPARIQAFDESYERVSDAMFAEQPLDPAKQRHWFDMCRAMVRFQRLVVPMREAASSLMRREHPAVAEQLYPCFEDVYDDILRVSETSDSLGRHHRSPRTGHRLLRHERPLPGLRRDVGCRRLHVVDGHRVSGPLPGVAPP